MTIEKYIEDKIFRYCDECKTKNIRVNMYTIHEKYKGDWWHIVAVKYGEWMKKNSTMGPITELSEQEW